MKRRHLRRAIVLTLFCGLYAGTVRAADDAIEGVQPAALDQPRIYVCFRRGSANASPLVAKANAGGAKAEQDKMLKQLGIAADAADNGPQIGAEAFLDTGASGVMLSTDTAQQLGIAAAKTRDGHAVKFQDVGVGGSEDFGVSEPLFMALAAYPKADQNNPASYSPPNRQPIRAQIRPPGGVLEMLAPGLDVAGMPVMMGKVVVMDPKPLADFDKIHTIVVPPGDREIPRTSRHVPLTYVSWARFTRVSPAGAPGPNLAPNPMIGPDPFVTSPTTAPAARSTSPRANPSSRVHSVEITYHGGTVTGTFLLDTGAATSMMSTRLADQLGIDFSKGNVKPAFSLSVGGLGGQKSAPGLFVDQLALPTHEGPPIRYVKAPLLVNDITVADEQGHTFTLDGVLGMNYLVASAEITGGLLPDVGKIIDGPWRWIVIDHARGELGLEAK